MVGGLDGGSLGLLLCQALGDESTGSRSEEER